MVLRGLLYQLTGDEEVAATAHHGRPDGLPDGDDGRRATRTSRCCAARPSSSSTRYRAAGAGPLDIGPEERLPLSLSLTLGEEIDDEEFEFCLEELALDPWAREPATGGSRRRRSGSQDFTVTVIGGGLGGLNAALQLKRAGIPYTVIEKNAGVGGTWYENRYPGARVDTPSRGYTHIFGVDFPYSSPFCDWAENQRYFDWVADTFELRDDIVFDTEVRSLTWDEDDVEWEIEIDGPEGRSTLRSNAVITAVGFLNRPKIPEIEGMEDFRGPLVAHGALAGGRRPRRASASPSSAPAAPATR